MSEDPPIPWRTTGSARSDAELIAVIREDGDQEAYGVLYERHVAAARSLARQLVRAETEVEDVVQDTFAKIFDLMTRGGGPEAGFRPYLLTAVRRTVYDRSGKERRQVATGEIERYDKGVPFVDPAVEGLERSMVAKAFLSLPERWQLILWHTEIEGDKPAEIAPLLGIKPNGVAALAYRAREGLRQAYLQMHLQIAPPDACRPVVEKLGAYVRGGLRKRESATVDGHLRDCNECNTVYLELADLNHSLKVFVGPLFAGPVLAGYLASGAASGGAAAVPSGVFGWWRRLPKQQQAGAAGTAAAVAAAAIALLLVAQREPTVPQEPPQAAPPKVQPPPPRPDPPRPKPPPEPPPPEASPEPPGPTPAVTPSPQPPARLTAAVDPVGSLIRDSPGLVGVRLHNRGEGASRDLVANVRLPPGVMVINGGKRGMSGPGAPSDAGDGWSCRTAKDGARCARGPLEAGARTALYVRVTVASDAPAGEAPAVRIAAGDQEVTARGTHGVRTAGATGRFATEGPVTTTAAGNALMSCRASAKGCERARQRKGRRRDNDLWRMDHLDLDRDKSTWNSSSAALALPKRGRVVWAGLYWSGASAGHGERDHRKGNQRVIRLRPPGGSGYKTVRAAEVDRVRLPSGPAYQSFADVTSIVREEGGGRWWAANAAASRGVAKFAGWSLVVVVTEPGAPYRQAVVLDAAAVVSRRHPRFDAPFGGLLPAAVPGRIDVVAWEGDAELAGDSAAIGGRTVVAGFDSTAEGAIGPANTFGTDVRTAKAALARNPVLRLVTKRDAYLFGAVAVSVRVRS